MNERIRELAEQAWDSARDEIGSFVDDGGEVNWDFLHTYDKKFAELIVRECIEVLNKRFMGDLNREDQEVRRCIKDLKKHFGVEE